MVAVAKRNDPPLKGHVEPFRKISGDMPGLSRSVELSVTDRVGPVGARPMTTAWISDRLLARTIDVWSRAYDRPITPQEAMEILMNVKRFAELLVRAKEEHRE